MWVHKTHLSTGPGTHRIVRKQRKQSVGTTIKIFIAINKWIMYGVSIMHTQTKSSFTRCDKNRLICDIRQLLQESFLRQHATVACRTNTPVYTTWVCRTSPVFVASCKHASPHLTTQFWHYYNNYYSYNHKIIWTQPLIIKFTALKKWFVDHIYIL